MVHTKRKCKACLSNMRVKYRKVGIRNKIAPVTNEFVEYARFIWSEKKEKCPILTKGSRQKRTIFISRTRDRTEMALLPADFESTASTCSAMRPKARLILGAKRTARQEVEAHRWASGRIHSSTTSKSSTPAPHTGQTKSSGRLSPSYS